MIRCDDDRSVLHDGSGICPCEETTYLSVGIMDATQVVFFNRSITVVQRNTILRCLEGRMRVDGQRQDDGRLRGLFQMLTRALHNKTIFLIAHSPRTNQTAETVQTRNYALVPNGYIIGIDHNAAGVEMCEVRVGIRAELLASHAGRDR